MSMLINNKYIKLLLFSVFCLTSATLGGFSSFGSEIHFEDNSVHIHYGNADHGLGKAGHSDANIVLYLDYVNTSNDITMYHTFNLSFSPECYNNSLNLFNIFSGIACYSNTNRFLPTNLHQLKSSYLI